MADKNKNGIDDALEKKSKAASYAAGPSTPSYGMPYGAAQGAVQKPAPRPTPTARVQVPNAPALPGVKQLDYSQDLWQGRKPAVPARQGPVDDSMSFADYLAQAMSLFGSGGSGGGSVNYDPQRGTARQNAAENDARLEAMYRQLRGSIDADAPVIQGNYQQAIDNTAQNAQSAQAQTQAASDNALARQDQVLASLGIQQAQGNQIQQGTDLSTQTAQTIGDQATKGQAAGDRLVSNQATALSHNTNIGNAAGLEGNLQRASNQAKLQALLAEIDMKEQQDNASLASSASGSGFSGALDLAKTLFGYDQDERRYQDELGMSAASLAQKSAVTPLPSLDEILQGFAARGFKIPEDDIGQIVDLINAGRKVSF